MRLFNFIRAASIYVKLLVTFLLVIVPLSVLSLTLSNYGAAQVKQDKLTALASQTHFYITSFETDMLRLIKLKKEYLFDEDLQTISVTGPSMMNFELSRAILRLQYKLYLLKTSSPYVDEVKVTVPSIERTIFSNNYDDEISIDELHAIESGLSSQDPIIQWNNQLLLGEIYPNYNRKGKTLFALEIILSKEEIKQTLRQITDMGGALLYKAGKDEYIATEDNIPLLELLQGTINQSLKDATHTNRIRVDVQGNSYWSVYEHSDTLNMTMVVYVPQSMILGQLNKYQIWFWVIFAGSLFIVVTASYWIYRLIHKPISLLVRAFRSVEKGATDVAVHHKRKDEFRYLYEQFNAMVKRLNILIHEVYEQKILAQRSELKQLQSQINPHFLYNSYFILYRMALAEDVENITRLTKHLGDYFQFITRSANDEVTLDMEVKHAYSYVEIQMIRYSRRIRTDWDTLPDEYAAVRVPRIILQPIIENAYEHGLKDKYSGGVVEIRMEIHSECLHISVEDNGDDLHEDILNQLISNLHSSDQSLETTGLINVHRRLQLVFGTPRGLQLMRGRSGGLRVIMEIPWKEDDQSV